MAYDIEALLRVWTMAPADEAEAVAAFRALYTDPVTVNGVRLTPHDLVARARTLQTTLEQPRREVIDVVEAGDKVAVAFRLTGRHAGPLSTQLGPVPATGRPLTLRVIDILTIVDGRIAAIEMVADELGALRALDAVALTPPSGADEGADLPA
jgi:ketosteroid isomerase-like protein